MEAPAFSRKELRTDASESKNYGGQKILSPASSRILIRVEERRRAINPEIALPENETPEASVNRFSSAFNRANVLCVARITPSHNCRRNKNLLHFTRHTGDWLS